MNQKFAKIITNLGNPFILIIPISHIFLYLFGFYNLTNLFLILFIQIFIPIILMLIFLKLKIISDFEITISKERNLYFFFLSILFLISLFFSNSSQSFLLNLSLTCGIIVILIVNFFWKISGHMLLDSICFMTISFLNPIFFITFPFFAIVGFTRFILKKHTIWQVVIGFIVGILVHGICNLIV